MWAVGRGAAPYRFGRGGRCASETIPISLARSDMPSGKYRSHHTFVFKYSIAPSFHFANFSLSCAFRRLPPHLVTAAPSPRPLSMPTAPESAFSSSEGSLSSPCPPTNPRRPPDPAPLPPDPAPLSPPQVQRHRHRGRRGPRRRRRAPPAPGSAEPLVRGRRVGNEVCV